MSIDIKVPVLPESVQDATIAAWHKQAGDFVARDENLVDIETDKVVLEVVAPADGVLETITRGEGETVIAEEVIGVFKEGASAGSQTEAKPESQPTEQLSSKDPGPSARRAAQEHGVDTNSLTGSGQGGRVTKQDVTTAAANTTNTIPSVIGIGDSTHHQDQSIMPHSFSAINNTVSNVGNDVPLTTIGFDSFIIYFPSTVCL